MTFLVADVPCTAMRSCCCCGVNSPRDDLSAFSSFATTTLLLSFFLRSSLLTTSSGSSCFCETCNNPLIVYVYVSMSRFLVFRTLVLQSRHIIFGSKKFHLMMMSALLPHYAGGPRRCQEVLDDEAWMVDFGWIDLVLLYH